MTLDAKSPDEYVSKVPEDRREVVARLRNTIRENLPKGFSEGMGYGMMGYHVPHSLYPAGYHCDPKQPLPFMGLASQKNAISLYHMGIYADEALLHWFQQEYAKAVPTKLDMGKSCIRFKKPEHIPFDLIAELCRKMSVKDWIDLYESKLKR